MEYRNPKELKPHPVSIELYGYNQIEDIRESISNLGILVPLTITKDNLIISGHRRWRCAIELELDSVPIEVKTFVNEVEEKRSILEYNRQRKKMFSQKMREAILLEDLVRKENEARMKHQPLPPTPISKEGEETTQTVGRITGIGGKDTYRKCKKIWDKAQEEDEKDLTWVKKLDNEEATINEAYTALFTTAHVNHSTGENEWYTPKAYIEAARAVMEAIDLDPASSDTANEIVGATNYYTIQDDGLQKEWNGNVWMNPPYAQPLIAQFCDLLVRNYTDGKIQQACVLVNNATETTFYQDMLSCCQAVCFIKGRIKFIDKEGKESGAPLQGQTILYFGTNSNKFTQYFAKFGVVLYAR